MELSGKLVLVELRCCVLESDTQGIFCQLGTYVSKWRQIDVSNIFRVL